MTEPVRPIEDEDIHAYVDGQLEVVRRGEVEAYLAANPDAAAHVAAYRAQTAALHAAFDSVLREATPAKLLQVRAPRWPVVLRRVAAAGLYVAVGFGAGYWAGSTDPGRSGIDQRVAEIDLPERAARAYVTFVSEVRHPVEVGAAEEGHLVTWLSKRLGTTVRVPKLSQLGFEFVGGRLLPDSHGPAGQLMYQDGQGRRITLYFRPGGGAEEATAFRWLRDGAVEVCFWTTGKVGYALAGQMPRPELLRLVEVIYQQLNV